MSIKTVIFKIGGKILDNSKYLIYSIAQLTQLYEDNVIQKIILIPGGGILANFVRTIYQEFRIDDELAHWIAIFSMNFNGLELNRKFPHIRIIEDFEKLRTLDHGFFIFLPYNYLRNNDQLPHNWDVTSDSITLYLAHQLGLNECFLIKDVDGVLDKKNQVIQKLTTSEFKKMKQEDNLAKINSSEIDLKEKSKPIDAYLTELIDQYKMGCILLNGFSSSLYILDYFTIPNSKQRIFTKITFNQSD